MSRKHSIALGMNGVLSVAYLILVIAYLYMVMQNHSSQREILSFRVAADDLFPHLMVMAVGTVLTVIAFFSNLFVVALMAIFAYVAAILLAGMPFYQYALLCIPLLLLAIAGSTFCYKRKQWLKEQEEERIYLATHPRPKVKRSAGSSYMDRMKNSPNYFQQPTNQGQNQTMMQNQTPYFDQGQNYYSTQSDGYYQQHQQPLLPQQMYNPLQDPYAPLTPPQQTPNYMTPYMGGYNYDTMYGTSPAAPMNDGSMTNPLYQGTMNAQPLSAPQINPLMNPTIQQPPMTQNALNYPQPSNNPTRSEGYFDDYGNFHPGGNNF